MSDVRFDLPSQVTEILDLLKAHTYTPYLVGDCVKELLLGGKPMDFDIVCDATLDRIEAIFYEKYRTREDFLYKGELIIISGGMGISVAPFRANFDGNGRPIYCDNLDDELRRRTFTAEAIAYNHDTGLYDKCNGAKCISPDKIILKALGERSFIAASEMPIKKRKGKKSAPPLVIPALERNPRGILEAMLKFSKGEAEITPVTLKNIQDNPQLLKRIHPAELMEWFEKIIMGKNVTEALLCFKSIVFCLFPVLRQEDGFEQNSSYQEFTLYEHTAKAVGFAVPDLKIRMALLFHGAGKADCAADRTYFTSYNGHGERAVMLTKSVLAEYSAPKVVIENICALIRRHDDKITPENYSDYVNAYGEDFTRDLLLFQSANVRAKGYDPVNERVSQSLRQLADGLSGTSVKTRRNTSPLTVTVDGLKNIVKMLDKNGI